MADNLTPKEEFLLNPVEEHNITDAAIVSFETNLKHPVKVTVPITPQQDLHGYDHPWPLGGSKNLAKYAGTGYYNSSGVFVQDDINGRCEPVFIASGTTVTSSTKIGRAVASHAIVAFRDITCTDLITRVGPVTDQTLSYTATEDCYIVAQINSGTTSNASLYEMSEDWYYNTVKAQLELGDTATDYMPCENICPIEGLTETNITGTAHNICDPDSKKSYTSGNWAYWYVPGSKSPYDKGILFRAGVHYYIRAYTPSSPSVAHTNTYIQPVRYGTTNAIASGLYSVNFVLTEDTLASIRLQSTSGKLGETLLQITTSEPSNDAEFIPYQGNSLPISWKHAEGTYNFNPIQAGSGDPSPDNVRPISPALTLTRDDNSVLTVYGGSITFRDDGTSRLIVNQDVYLLNSVDQIYSYPWRNGVDGAKAMLGNRLPKSQEDYALSGMAQLYISDSRIFRNDVNASLRENQFSCYRAVGYGVSVGFNPQIVGETKAELGAYLSENPITFVYPLLHPETYTLSVSETQRAIAALGDKVSTTVYGGTVTLNEDGSADVVSAWAMREYDGSSDESWDITTRERARVTISPNAKYVSSSSASIICNKLKSASGNQAELGTIDNIAFVAYGNRLGIRLDSIYTTVEQIRAWLQSNPIQMCYELATPITYHFPNVGQLKAFLGTNNVWSDIGNVDVKYLTQHSETGLEYRGDRALELRRRAMIGDAPTIHTSVGSEETGGLASFKSYIKAPVKKIEIPFSPKQDLHGYDHPWPGGGGKNLFDPDATWTAYTQNIPRLWLKIVDESCELHISNVVKDSTIDLTGVSLGWAYDIEDINAGVSIVLQNGTWMSGRENNILSNEQRAKWLYISTSSPYTEEHVREALVSVMQKYDIQVELGSTATDYEPYENICPIEGHDGINISGTKKNLFDVSQAEILRKNIYNTSGVITGNNYYDLILTYVPIKPGKYVFSNSVNTNSGGPVIVVCLYDSNKSFISRVSLQTHFLGAWSEAITIPEGVSYIRFSMVHGTTSSGYLTSPFDTLQIEFGSTKSEYEAYHGASLPLTFNQSGGHSFTPIQEGTGNPSPENVRPIYPGLTITRDDDSVLSVYGGTLTVNTDGTGSLVSRWVKYKPNMNKHFLVGQYSAALLTQGIPIATKVRSLRGAFGNMLTELLPGLGRSRDVNDARTKNGGFAIADDSGNQLIIYDPDTTITQQEMVAKYKDLELVYPLNTPNNTYTLSVTETNRALEALGLTQHIGPIYGGTVTINPDGSADVVATLGKYVLDGTGGYWAKQGSTGWYRTNHPFALTGGVNYRSYCDSLEKMYNYNVTQFGITFGYPGANRLIITGSQADYTTDNELNAYFTNHPVTCVSILATPQTYHFSNLEQLKVWLGENNFWCDISDDITVKYWNRG